MTAGLQSEPGDLAGTNPEHTLPRRFPAVAGLPSALYCRQHESSEFTNPIRK